MGRELEEENGTYDVWLCAREDTNYIYAYILWSSVFSCPILPLINVIFLLLHCSVYTPIYL